MAFQIDIYSHCFRLTGYNADEHRLVSEFIRRYLTQFGMVPVGFNRFERKPIKVFAAATKERTEYRFHIHMLDQFLQWLTAVNFVSPSSIHKTTHSLYTPADVLLKMNERITPFDYQVPMIRYLVEDGVMKILILQTGRGKAQPFDAKIKVPGGWKEMKDIIVGDTITAKDGTPTKVTGVFPQGRKDIYKVTFADGRSTECCEDHLWKIYRPNRVWDSKVVDTKEMIRLKQLSNNRLYIDLPDPEIGTDVTLPIDPYVLGVIIGNGCIQKDRVSISSNDGETLTEFQRLLPPNVIIRYSGGYDYRIICPDMRGNPLLESLRTLNLDNTRSHEKHIPEIYLNASASQRLSLLQGLMDTDGTASTDGSPSYSTSSQRLAKDVQSLVRSLGGHASIRTKKPFYTYNDEYKQGRDSFIIGIRIKTPASLFRLPRKRERVDYVNQYSETLKLGVESIELVSNKHAICISIDHPDKLYVTDEYVVTHNTAVSLFAACEIGKRTVLIIRGMYVDRWMKDLKADLGLKPGELILVRGSKDLINLIAMARSPDFKAKFIVITNRTFQNFINFYELRGDATHFYGCNPQDFYEVLKVGTRINDEFHQDFHLNTKMDCYTHIPKSIVLTATLVSDNRFTAQMYDMVCPVLKRYQGAEYHRYIIAKSLHYRLNDPSRIKYISRMKTYSHAEFEKSLMRKENKDMLTNYISLIVFVVQNAFVSKMEIGQRMLVFCATIQMCNLVTERLKRQYPDMFVGRYVEDDDYSVLEKNDITVSTVLSAGTAVDIKGLRITFMTTALGSISSNEQALGRTRELKQWPDTDPEFLYLVCDDIPKHVEYDKRKRQHFATKVKGHTSLLIDIRV